jgi:hypothetical protein
MQFFKNSSSKRYNPEDDVHYDEKTNLIREYSDDDYMNLLKDLKKNITKNNNLINCDYFKRLISDDQKKKWIRFLSKYREFAARNNLLLEIFYKNYIIDNSLYKKESIEPKNIIDDSEYNIIDDSEYKYLTEESIQKIKIYIDKQKNDFAEFKNYIDSIYSSCNLEMNSDFSINSNVKDDEDFGLHKKSNTVVANDKNDIGIDSHAVKDVGGANKKRTRHNKNKKIKRKRKTARKTRIH